LLGLRIAGFDPEWTLAVSASRFSGKTVTRLGSIEMVEQQVIFPAVLTFTCHDREYLHEPAERA
jgi:hypothetical protein